MWQLSHGMDVLLMILLGVIVGLMVTVVAVSSQRKQNIVHARKTIQTELEPIEQFISFAN